MTGGEANRASWMAGRRRRPGGLAFDDGEDHAGVLVGVHPGRGYADQFTQVLQEPELVLVPASQLQDKRLLGETFGSFGHGSEL